MQENAISQRNEKSYGWKIQHVLLKVHDDKVLKLFWNLFNFMAIRNFQIFCTFLNVSNTSLSATFLGWSSHFLSEKLNWTNVELLFQWNQAMPLVDHEPVCTLSKSHIIEEVNRWKANQIIARCHIQDLMQTKQLIKPCPRTTKKLLVLPRKEFRIVNGFLNRLGLFINLKRCGQI